MSKRCIFWIKKGMWSKFFIWNRRNGEIVTFSNMILYQVVLSSFSKLIWTHLNVEICKSHNFLINWNTCECTSLQTQYIISTMLRRTRTKASKSPCENLISSRISDAFSTVLIRTNTHTYITAILYIYNTGTIFDIADTFNRGPSVFLRDTNLGCFNPLSKHFSDTW